MISIEDMAFELAEYDYLHAPVQYLLDAYTDQWQDNQNIQKALDKAWREVHKEWTSKTDEAIQAAYTQLISTEEYNDEPL